LRINYLFTFAAFKIILIRISYRRSAFLTVFDLTYLSILFYLIMNIFVAKLSSSTTSDDLRTLFEEYGEVTSANVITDRMTGYSKKFGFVEMSNDDEANKAIKELDNCQYDHAEIVVKKARPREDAPREKRYSNYR